jgi:hypothetical protein
MNICFFLVSAQILPEFTSIVVRPQPNVILQTLPDVVTEFFDSIPPPGSGSPSGPTPSTGFEQKQQNLWNNNNLVLSNVRCKQEVKECSVDMDGSASLADLDCLTDLLGGSQNSQAPSGAEQLLKLELMDGLEDDDKLDSCWESGSSSSSGGSHFEFSCTQDVSDMLSDIGVSEVDWGCDDMMMIKI